MANTSQEEPSTSSGFNTTQEEESIGFSIAMSLSNVSKVNKHITVFVSLIYVHSKGK